MPREQQVRGRVLPHPLRAEGVGGGGGGGGTMADVPAAAGESDVRAGEVKGGRGGGGGDPRESI